MSFNTNNRFAPLAAASGSKKTSGSAVPDGKFTFSAAQAARMQPGPSSGPARTTKKPSGFISSSSGATSGTHNSHPQMATASYIRQAQLPRRVIHCRPLGSNAGPPMVVEYRHSGASSRLTPKVVKDHIAARYAKYRPDQAKLDQIEDFRAAKGRQPAYEGCRHTDFPALIPDLYLLSDEDRCKQASLSYSNIAARNVAAGSKISPRSSRFSAYSWKETSTKAEDWLPVSPCQEDLFWRLPGGAYQAQYNLPANAVSSGGHRTMAWEYGPSGHISLE